MELSCFCTPVSPVSSARMVFGELFAEFDTPLVEAVDAPDNALDEGFVFVHGNQAAHVAGVDFVHEDEVGRAVAGEGFCAEPALRCALLPCLGL